MDVVQGRSFDGQVAAVPPVDAATGEAVACGVQHDVADGPVRGVLGVYRGGRHISYRQVLDDDVVHTRTAYAACRARDDGVGPRRSEAHTSELQSLMPIPYAVFCLKKKNISLKQS